MLGSAIRPPKHLSLGEPTVPDGDELWLALGWEPGIGTTGQCPRQDLIPANMDDGFHHRDTSWIDRLRTTKSRSCSATPGHC